MRFKDKVTIVTGGASGIGHATAVRFAREGAKVVIVDTNHSAAEQTVAEIAFNKGTAFHIAANIADEKAVIEAVNQTKKAFGRIDILVNNAVKFIFKGLDATLEELQESLDTNVVGHFLMTKHVSAEMKKVRAGSIVFVASISSVIGQENAVTYNTAKTAILGLMRTAAVELAPNIRVNAVSPGHVFTPAIPPIAEKSGMSLEAFEKARAQTTLLKRVADPSEIANAILFFASDEASYITGANLMVDAGYTTV